MGTGSATPRQAQGRPSALDLAVHRFWRRQALPPGIRVLVAVSGGADSVCLLHLLHALAPEFELTLHVAHFHHGLRAAADGDAAFVAALADSLGLPATFGAAEIVAEAAATKRSLEAAAHERRWAFLEATRRRVGAALIAVGHTADDQAETVLMRMLRGAGLDGLAGLAPRKGVVARPLLSARHSACVTWCRYHGLEWREDESNAAPWCRRNAVRLEGLPFLRRYNPELDTTLAAMAETLQMDRDYLQAQAALAYRTLIRRDAAGDERLDLAGYGAAPEAIRRRLLVQWFGRAAARTHILAADELLANGHAGEALALPGKRQLVRQYSDAVLRPLASPAPAAPVTLSVPGVTDALDRRWRVTAELTDPTPASAAGRWSADLDAAAVTLPLTLRSRRPGDRMLLPGVAGPKKIQDMLVDARTPRRERDSVGVIEAVNGIAWLVGYRVAAWARPTAATSRILRLIITPSEATDADGEDAEGP